MSKERLAPSGLLLIPTFPRGVTEINSVHAHSFAVQYNIIYHWVKGSQPIREEDTRITHIYVRTMRAVMEWGDWGWPG